LQRKVATTDLFTLFCHSSPRKGRPPDQPHPLLDLGPGGR